MTNSLEETKKELNNILRDDRIKNLYHGKRLDNLKSILNLLIEQLELITNDEDVNVTDTDIKNVLSILHFLEKYTIERELDDFKIDFINKFNLLMFNWNTNTTNNSDIELASKTLKMLVDQHYTLTLAIRTMKILLNHLRKYSEAAPLSINLSKHYLNILREEKDG